eukprot:jgi/Botrbrau1/7803/Bobra.0159s0231.1
MYEAFWGMLLPTTTSFRVCDIWRGYFTQRLLWELGAQLVFLPPSVYQQRNAHSEHADFMDEVELYADADRLVTFLRDWKPQSMTLPDMAKELAQDMAERKFWGQADVTLVGAWVADLTSIGYQWPAVVEASSSGINSGASDILNQPLHTRRHNVQSPPAIVLEPVHNITNASREAVELYTTNPDHTSSFLPRWWCQQPDLVLVIMYNHPVHIRTVELLNRAYRSMFHKVVHTGYVAKEIHSPEELERMEFKEQVTWTDCRQFSGYQGGHLMYECFANVIQDHRAPPGGGYFIIGDDLMFNPCLLCSFNLDQIWYITDNTAKQTEFDYNGKMGFMSIEDKEYWIHWEEREEGVRTKDALINAIMGLNDTQFYQWQQIYLNSTGHVYRFFSHATPDIFYLPERVAGEFLVLASYFRQAKLYVELALPQIIAIINNGTDNLQFLQGHMEYEGLRDIPALWGLTTNGLYKGRAFYHPLKLSRYWQEFVTWWTSLSCRVAEPSIFSNRTTFRSNSAEMCAAQRSLPLIAHREDIDI